MSVIKKTFYNSSREKVHKSKFNETRRTTK